MKNLFLLITLTATLYCCTGTAPAPTIETKSAASITVVMPTDSMPQTRLDTLKMGRIMEGEVVQAQFTLQNNSDKPLVIASTVTGCGCTAVKYDPAPIMPHKSTEFNVTFDSKDRYGKQLKTIEIISADSRVARIMLECDVILKQ